MKGVTLIARSWKKQKPRDFGGLHQFRRVRTTRAESASPRLTKHAGIYGRHAMRRTKTGLSMRPPKCIRQRPYLTNVEASAVATDNGHRNTYLARHQLASLVPV